MKDIPSAAERSCRVARIAGGLGTIGLTLDAIVDLAVGPPSAAQLFGIAACGAVWLWTLVRRNHPSLVFGSLAFLAINAAILVALTSAAQRIAESGVHWVPFRAHQLGMLTVALLAPPVAWVGAITIVGTVATVLIQYQRFPAEVAAQLPHGEPWSTMFFAGFALVLLFFRLRADVNEREAVRAQAKAEAYQAYARAMLAVRDLANTPLQTLTNLTELLRAHGPEVAGISDRLERAVARLTELEEATRPFERELELRAGQESLDPRTVLRDTAARP